MPRLALIADRFTAPEMADRAVAAIEGGVRWVHLRDHGATEAVFSEAAHRLAERLREVRGDVQLSVNTRAPVAETLDAGLHLGTRGPSVAGARERLGEEALLGFSAHDEQEGRRAVEAGARYLFFSPIFRTTSKPGHPGQGTEALHRFCAASPQTPVLALGGITPKRVASCLAAGAHGVAVLSGILHAENPSQTAAIYLQALATE